MDIRIWSTLQRISVPYTVVVPKKNLRCKFPIATSHCPQHQVDGLSRRYSGNWLSASKWSLAFVVRNLVPTHRRPFSTPSSPPICQPQRVAVHYGVWDKKWLREPCNSISFGCIFACTVLYVFVNRMCL